MILCFCSLGFTTAKAIELIIRIQEYKGSVLVCVSRFVNLRLILTPSLLSVFTRYITGQQFILILYLANTKKTNFKSIENR